MLIFQTKSISESVNNAFKIKHNYTGRILRNNKLFIIKKFINNKST